MPTVGSGCREKIKLVPAWDREYQPSLYDLAVSGKLEAWYTVFIVLSSWRCRVRYQMVYIDQDMSAGLDTYNADPAQPLTAPEEEVEGRVQPRLSAVDTDMREVYTPLRVQCMLSAMQSIHSLIMYHSSRCCSRRFVGLFHRIDGLDLVHPPEDPTGMPLTLYLEAVHTLLWCDDSLICGGCLQLCCCTVVVIMCYAVQLNIITRGQNHLWIV